MKNMMLYLESNPQIKEVLLVLGQKSNINIVRDILSGMQLKKITVSVATTKLEKAFKNLMEDIHGDKKYYIPEKIECVKQNKQFEYTKEYDEMAIIFNALKDKEFLMSLKMIYPKYLIGVCRKNEVSKFDIWEGFRNYVQQMYIISNNVKQEVLNWKKDPDSDIELSIIFPMYNIAKYLPQCIESVTEWKADYIEFLFVDDGSPDNCAEIVEEYAKNDARIKLLKKVNGGCASARQYGLERAKGRYIGLIDPDDYIEPSMFRKLLSRALDGSYEIAYSGYNEYYENTGTTREVPDTIGYPYEEGTSDPTMINQLICHQRVAIWRGIYSRNLINRGKIHFYTDLRRFDDLPFKVEVLSKARSVVAVPEYLYYYRMSRPGQDVAADDERLYVHFPIFEYLDDYIRKSFDKRQVDYLQLVKVHTHMYALGKIKKEFVKEYCKQAKKDIRSNFGYLEGCYVVNKLGSIVDVFHYTELYFGMAGLIQWLKEKPARKRKDKNAEAISKLKTLNTKGI